MNRLFSNLEHFAERIALVGDDFGEISYRELAERADKQAAQVCDGPGLLLLELDNALDSVLLLIGAARKGNPVMLVGPRDSNPATRLVKAFQPDFAYPRPERYDRPGALESTERPNSTADHPDLALLLATSGSTGSSKFVRLSHENLTANAASIAEYLSIGPDDRAIATLPLHYSFGLSILTSHLQCGASIVLTKHSVIDAALWDEMERHQVTSLSGVPRTFETLEKSGFYDKALPHLQTLTQAGGKLNPELVSRFARHSSERNRRFFVMYGQTEASPRIAYLPPDLAEENPDAIGLPIPGGAISIVDKSGKPIESADLSGELVYEGPNVMMGYALKRNDLALPSGPQRLETGDIAIRKSNGLFKIVGRASRFVKLAGLRIDLDEVERSIRDKDIPCLVAGDDNGIAVAIESEGSPELSELGKRLQTLLKIPPNQLRIAALPHLPTLPSGKPDYRRTLSLVREAAADRPRSLRDNLARVLGVAALDDQKNFNTSGGDSLNFIEANFLIEDHFGKTVPGWERIPFGKLAPRHAAETVPIESSESLETDPLLVARSLAIFLVMISHAFLQFRVWDQLPDWLRLFSRAAPPAFFIVFGIGIARSFGETLKDHTLRSLANRFLPKARVHPGP